MSNISTITLANSTYNIKDANVYTLFASFYSNSNTYKVGDYCIYNYQLYRCKTAINISENFDSNKWDLVTLASELGNINTVLESVL